MTTMYRRRLAVEAKQLWPSQKPWPEGVFFDTDSDTYWLDGGSDIYGRVRSRVVRVYPGDWIVAHNMPYFVFAREVWTPANFGAMWEPVHPKESKQAKAGKVE